MGLQNVGKAPARYGAYIATRNCTRYVLRQRRTDAGKQRWLDVLRERMECGHGAIAAWIPNALMQKGKVGPHEGVRVSSGDLPLAFEVQGLQ